MTTESAAYVHPFTKAGMGEAPFRPVAETEERRKERLAGAFGVCDRCHHIIGRVFYVKSACGKVSMVGCDCFEMTWQDGESEAVKDRVEAMIEAAKKADRAEAKKRKADVVHNTLVRLDEVAVRDALAARPHPKGRKGETMLDWCIWMANNAGAKGKGEVASAIKSLKI